MMLEDFEGLAPRAMAGEGETALDPTLLPQSEGIALLGVPPPELESFKLAQLARAFGLRSTKVGDIDGFVRGLPAGLAFSFSAPSKLACAMTCGGAIQDELAGAPPVVFSSDDGLSGGFGQSGSIFASSSLLVSTAITEAMGAEVVRACLSSASPFIKTSPSATSLNTGVSLVPS